jgi:hypothetical protein
MASLAAAWPLDLLIPAWAMQGARRMRWVSWRVRWLREEERRMERLQLQANVKATGWRPC